MHTLLIMLIDARSKTSIPANVLKRCSDFPWQDLAPDLFSYNKKEYLLVTDTYSKYPFVYQTSSKSAESIIQKLQNLIYQYGPPKRYFTDNGPPFLSEALEKFLPLLCPNIFLKSSLQMHLDFFLYL